MILPVSARDARDTGSISGSGRSPRGGNGNALQHSCLENSMDRGVWWASVHGVAKSWARLKQLSTYDDHISRKTYGDKYRLQRFVCVCVCVCVRVCAPVCQKKNSYPQPMMLAQQWPHSGTSLEVQWLRLCTFTAGAADSIPGWKIKILHAVWCGQINKQINKTYHILTLRRNKLPSAAAETYAQNWHLPAI